MVDDARSALHQSALVLELDPRDRSSVNFVWAVGEAQGAHAGIGPREPELTRHARTPMGLNRVVDDLQRHDGGLDLLGKDFKESGHVGKFVAVRVLETYVEDMGPVANLAAAYLGSLLERAFSDQ